MNGKSFDADSLSSKLMVDGRVEVIFSMFKGRFLDQLIKTDLRLAYGKNDNRLLIFLLLIKGMVLVLCSSLFFRDITDVYDFYIMNRSRINIRKERTENGLAKFVFFLS
ncbi:hypothetical protein [Marinobacterium rhizophilum]|uniref:Uncharacterized protein n=1 Tax=Marinobacterium rhizophilum TaxID=420402 RepID=A0ABY5HHT5_9GAMM|nr:hypothetical protein [Marinobacterium rhizophilum]UTW11534.1 hypothetical protein KDW95_20135 [Marinobacterium rhizophilum]